MTRIARMRMSRSAVKRIINSGLGRLDSRLVTSSDVEAQSRRYREVVQALYDVYKVHVVSGLRERDGRLDLLTALRGTQVPEALYMLDYLQGALDGGGGDVVEMGVAQGATSAMLANEIKHDPTRQLWLYDSFEGLSEPTSEDELIDDMEQRGLMEAYAGAMASPESAVRARLEAIEFPVNRTRVVKGFLNADMPAPDLVAFAYLDFDLYAPILTGLRMLHPRTRPGSVLMVDDYRFFSAGVEKAVHKFLTDNYGSYRFHEAPEHAGRFCALVRTS